MICTGIGSRETPKLILTEMAALGEQLSGLGHTLRSGGADGADAAFETGWNRGYRGSTEIYLPWENFNANASTLFGVSPLALNIAARLHPAWAKCSRGAKLLHGRNVYQVLGSELDKPSDFVVCYAVENGGGTATAIKLAKEYGIPVFNIWEIGLEEMSKGVKELVSG